ncbi:helix-turn-helix domain-containing protein [Siminovitchia sediminis]|uniref:Helix-turn-helix domain-containing protein n=1 Tax=Siminovitchia sediminis TaxID=1274353 RepID=A0ABW4KIM2_9BACI
MIGKKIGSIRRKKGLSLTELAQRANISKSYLSNIERDLNQNPSINIVKNIAEVLEVDFQELVGTDVNSEHKDEEWVHFVRTLKESGIKKEEIKEYETLIEFINWKKQSGK